ncbi:unnamed protein product, partial [Prorocentrum cordatum]
TLPVTAPRPAPVLSVVARPGDALYVPRGLECRTARRAAEAPELPGTLYLILVVRSGEQSLEISLGRYVNDLLMDKSLPSDADAFLRSAVTKPVVPERYGGGVGGAAVAGREGGRAGLEAALAGAAGELASRISAGGLRAHFLGQMRQRAEAQQAQAAKMRSKLEVPPPPDFVLERRAVRVARGVQCTCQPGSTVARFRRGADTLNLPIESSASALVAALSDGKPHRVGTLPCEDPFERLSVCQILVDKECVEARWGK